MSTQVAGSRSRRPTLRHGLATALPNSENPVVSSATASAVKDTLHVSHQQTVVPKTPLSQARLPTPPKPAVVRSERPEGKRGQVPITELMATMGWHETSWQTQVLREYDNGDGLISIKELRKSAKNPDHKNLITSINLATLETLAATGKSIDGLRGWQQELAVSAQKALQTVAMGVLQTLVLPKEGIVGTIAVNDNVISAAEVRAYGRALAQGLITTDKYFLANQRLFMLQQAVDWMTGEPFIANFGVPNNPEGETARADYVHVFGSSLYQAFHSGLGTSSVVDWGNYSEDLRYTGGTKRSDRFYTPGNVPEAPTQAVYTGSGYDRGHLAGRDFFALQDDADESFATTNLHPQTPASNQHVFAGVEQDARNELLDNNARMVGVTGVLFADHNLNPLAKEELQWIAGNKGAGSTAETEGLKRVVVPDYTFASFLQQRQTKDGKFVYAVRCFLVANRQDLDLRSKPLEVPELQAGMNENERRAAIAVFMQKNGSAELSLDDLQMFLPKDMLLFKDMQKYVREQISKKSGTFSQSVLREWIGG